MSEETKQARQNTERLFARVFTIIGGLFWIGTAFAGPYVYGGASLAGAFGVAVYPLIFTVGVLAIGWFYERLISFVLAIAAVGTVAWGVIMGWEPNVWAIMLLFFVVPTVVASALFFLAGGKSSTGGGQGHSNTEALGA
ncbi:MAG: hypothetical protein HGB10_07680 [Coriobacteriia bacterium]|nr:hypothetical protein [Coriobacteriia bacterium]